MKFFLIIALTIFSWSLDIDDIENLRKNNVKVAFSNTKSLQSIPRGMSPREFKKATILDFNGMYLSNNLPDLREMRKLRILNLSSVNIKLEELKKIEGLDLSVLNLNNNPNLFKNKESIIAFLSKFSLEELYLSHTKGDESSFMAIGTTFPDLRILDLSHNKLKSLNKLYLNRLSNLETLNLSNNFIVSFSTKELPKMTLKHLNLASNCFKKFDYTGDFPSLVSLDLSGFWNKNGDGKKIKVNIDTKYKGAMVLQSLQKISPSNLGLNTNKSKKFSLKSPPPNFCHVKARNLKVKHYESTIYDNKNNLLMMNIEAYYSNIYDDMDIFINRKDTDYKEGVEGLKRIGSKVELSYYMVIPKTLENITFSYYNTDSKEFIDRTVPIIPEY